MKAYKDRFWAKVAIAGETSCWQWRGSLASGGYGQIRREDGHLVAAHRASWELVHGTIPDGMVIDHLCRNRGCVNPSHLEVVTRGENVRRGLKTYALRTTCKQGHDITDPANVKVRPNGSRECRTCSRISWRKSMERRAA